MSAKKIKEFSWLYTIINPATKFIIVNTNPMIFNANAILYALQLNSFIFFADITIPTILTIIPINGTSQAIQLITPKIIGAFDFFI